MRSRICVSTRALTRVLNHVLSRAHSHFSVPRLLTLFTLALACAPSHPQSSQPADTQTASAVSRAALEFPDKQDVLRRIAVFEDFARNANSLHIDHQDLIKVYKNLGVLYELAGTFPKSVAATERVIDLMKDGPQNELAEQYNVLSSIHGLMGDVRQSEKDEMHALAIREKIGDPVGIALTWTDIAGLYCQENHYKKALEFAQKSYDVLASHAGMDPTNHVAVLQTFAFALCGTHQCSKGVPVMKTALEESKSAFGPDSLSAAAQGFALGYVYWKNGDTAKAAEMMRVSLALMKTYIGWGAPLYVNSMKQYAQFLHQAGEPEEARNTESEIHTIQSMVDARTLTTRGAEFLSPGKH